VDKFVENLHATVPQARYYRLCGISVIF